MLGEQGLADGDRQGLSGLRQAGLERLYRFQCLRHPDDEVRVGHLRQDVAAVLGDLDLSREQHLHPLATVRCGNQVGKDAAPRDPDDRDAVVLGDLAKLLVVGEALPVRR